jgi:cobalt/nickel transport system permease protein
MVAAVYFMTTLMRIPVGPASTHLVLTGMIGLLLGWAAFPAVGAALFLQTVLFGFGGLTSWGANVLSTALPAVVCSYLFGPLLRRAGEPRAAFLLGAAAGAAGVLLSGTMLAGTLFLSGREFVGVGAAILLSHCPVILVEAVATGAIVSFLMRVSPETLRG